MALTKNKVGARASPWHRHRFQIGLRGALVGLTLACMAAALASYWLEVRYQHRLARIEEEVELSIFESRKYAHRDPESAHTNLQLVMQLVEHPRLLKDRDRRRFLQALQAEKYPPLPELERGRCYDCVRIENIPVEEPVTYGDGCG